MDRNLKNPNSLRERRFDRSRKDYKSPDYRRGGRYGDSDRRPKRFYKQSDSRSYNKSKHKNALGEIRELLKEIIANQKKTLSLLDENQVFDNRITMALEIIASKTQ